MIPERSNEGGSSYNIEQRVATFGMSQHVGGEITVSEKNMLDQD
jgi:hypothetical protein